MLKAYIKLQKEGSLPDFNPMPSKEFKALIEERHKNEPGKIKIKDLLRKDKCLDLFRDFDYQHHYNKGTKEFVQQFINMKISIALKMKHINKLNTYIKTGVFRGR